MHHISRLRALTAAVVCLLVLYPLPLGVRADEVNNLIETILEASPTARAGAASYSAEAAKRTPAKKTPDKKEPPTAAPKRSVPTLQIPGEDLLEVSSRFPKNYIGKYVYGPVILHDYQAYEYDDSALIGFTAKNWRGFYLETRDPLIIEKFSKLRRGMKFMIPRDFPLRIVGKPGLSYILNMPFEKFLSHKEYIGAKLKQH